MIRVPVRIIGVVIVQFLRERLERQQTVGISRSSGQSVELHVLEREHQSTIN